MSDNVKEFFDNAQSRMAKMKEMTPDTVAGFSGMFGKIMKDGAVSAKNKELIALGIGVAMHCEPCIRAHVQKSLSLGATKEEILEAASVAVVMCGGPAYMHISMVIETLEALAK
jgi:AhpD family alkylhydroperoxidase